MMTKIIITGHNRTLFSQGKNTHFKVKTIDQGKHSFFEIFGNATEQTGLYAMGYMDNGLMLLPPSSLILVAVYIWIQKLRNPSLIETH